MVSVHQEGRNPRTSLVSAAILSARAAEPALTIADSAVAVLAGSDDGGWPDGETPWIILKWPLESLLASGDALIYIDGVCMNCLELGIF